MSRITRSMESTLDTRAGRVFMRAHYASATLAALGAMLLAACTLGTPAAVSDIRYDLGPAPKTHPSVVPLPAVRMFEVRSPRALDSDAILYRMNYVDPRQTASYAHSHWTMAPPQLLTQRLRSALAHPAYWPASSGNAVGFSLSVESGDTGLTGLSGPTATVWPGALALQVITQTS